MVIRTDMIIGFGVLLVSAIVVHLILINAAKGKGDSDKLNPDKVKNLFLRAVYPVLVGGFIIAMLWTGYTAKPDENKPQGELDQKNKPGVMTYEKGKNSPEEARKRLDEDAKKGQKESMDDLEKFRQEKLKNTKDQGESK